MNRLSLGSAIAELARAKRNWQRFLPKVGTGPDLKAGGPVHAGANRLTETLGFGDNPGALRMWSYVPSTAPAHPALVVVLHGCTQDAAGYDRHSGWSRLAERAGFAVLFAEQQALNNKNTCFNWFLPGDIHRDQGEPRSIRQMIDRLCADRHIDRRRIFVTGLSAGGAMANVMLATYPEIFAAGAIIAGLPYGCASNMMEALGVMKSPPVKRASEWGALVRGATDGVGPYPAVSIWHGSGDRVVSLSNGRACASQWTDVHGLKETVFTERTMKPGVTRRVWGEFDGQPKVEMFTLDGFGHGAPIDPAGRDGEPSGIPGPFMLEAPLSSTLVMARRWGLV